ncbi:MAG: AraC family transcriptional regulator [Clostridiaceae bacterium]|nr:AraC family transcriptional regulator [Clostridiaceae bacterium]
MDASPIDRNFAYQEPVQTPRYELPILFHRDVLRQGNQAHAFNRHWHVQVELLFIISGEVVIECNTRPIRASAGDLVAINSNEMHKGNSATPKSVYDCLLVDPSLFQTRTLDVCETKYIQPIYQNGILFDNLVPKDSAVRSCFRRIVQENKHKENGYEIAVKAAVYELFAVLLRRYTHVGLSPKAYSRRLNGLLRLNQVLDHLEQHYQENLTLAELSSLAGLSRYRFCHLFKEMTGRTPVEYLNQLRVRQAGRLLLDGRHNISEIAGLCGFSDANYFSRVFKQYQKASPSLYRREAETGHAGFQI